MVLSLYLCVLYLLMEMVKSIYAFICNNILFKSCIVILGCCSIHYTYSIQYNYIYYSILYLYIYIYIYIYIYSDSMDIMVKSNNY